MSISARDEVVTNARRTWANGNYRALDPSVMRFDGHSASPVQVAGRAEFGLNYLPLEERGRSSLAVKYCQMDFKFISSANDLYLRVRYPRGTYCTLRYTLPDRFSIRPDEVWAIDGAGSASPHAMRRVLCCWYPGRIRDLMDNTLVSPLLTAAATSTPCLLPPRARHNPYEPPRSPLHPRCHLRSSLPSHAAQRVRICVLRFRST